MRVTWHPEAEVEMIEAARFYNQRVAGLGLEFLDAVDAAIAQITTDPDRFPHVADDVQRCRVQRFPYCVYLRRLRNSIRILVVKHHSRDPDFGKSRE